MAGIFLDSMPLDGRTGHETGRLLLARMYREYAGEPMPSIRVTDRGKPYFSHSPWHFSISHTKSRAFCALSTVPVGLDAEELSRKVRPELAARILSPGEFARYAAAPDPNLALLTFWVLKEAAGKLSGKGLNGWPNHTNFRLDDPRIQYRDGCILAIVTKES